MLARAQDDRTNRARLWKYCLCATAGAFETLGVVPRVPVRLQCQSQQWPRDVELSGVNSGFWEFPESGEQYLKDLCS